VQTRKGDSAHKNLNQVLAEALRAAQQRESTGQQCFIERITVYNNVCVSDASRDGISPCIEVSLAATQPEPAPAVSFAELQLNVMHTNEHAAAPLQKHVRYLSTQGLRCCCAIVLAMAMASLESM
jgi:hypothetical protein